MSTGLAVQENGAANRVAVRIGERGLDPTDFDQMWRCATVINRSGMAPKSLDTAEKIFVACCHGKEIGLSVMQSMQNIAVINGKPGIFGDCAKALVESSSVCEYVEEKIEGTGDAMRAVCTAKRKGRKSETVQAFSIEDAKKAGLWGKAGPWTNYPKRMLQMRARGFCLRDAFPDVLGGLRTVEELQDFPDGEAVLERRLVSGDSIGGDDLDIVEQELLKETPAVSPPAKPQPVSEHLLHNIPDAKTFTDSFLADCWTAMCDAGTPDDVEAVREFHCKQGKNLADSLAVNKLADKRLAELKKPRGKGKQTEMALGEGSTT